MVSDGKKDGQGHVGRLEKKGPGGRPEETLNAVVRPAGNPLPETSAPTWARHCFRPHSQVKEISKALEYEYGHFLAVLKPERTFLHYLISGVVGNTRVRDRDHLQNTVETLYTKHVAEVSRAYEEKKSGFEKDLETFARLATGFYERKAIGFPSNLMLVGDDDQGMVPGLVESFQQSTEALGSKHGAGTAIEGVPSTSDTHSTEKLLDKMEAIYDTIDYHMHHRKFDYAPGKEDIDLDTGEKVFVAFCVDRLREQQIKSVVKPIADKAIKAMIASGKIEELPKYDATARNTVISGTIASGKTRLLSQLSQANTPLGKTVGIKGIVDRTNAITIDIDEFRDLDKLLAKADPLKPSTANGKKDPEWGGRVHDECHMIRRKIFDEIEHQEQRGYQRNVILMTSHLSPRICRWMGRSSKPTDLCCLYCDPQKALENSRIRAERDGGYPLPKRTILSSYGDLAAALKYLFRLPDAATFDVSATLLDTSHVDTKKLETGPDLMEGARRIMTANSNSGVIIHNFERFCRVYDGAALTPEGLAIKLPLRPLKRDVSDDTILTMRADLKKHTVSFLNGDDEKCVAKKKPGHMIPEKFDEAMYAGSENFRRYLTGKMASGVSGAGGPLGA